MFSISKIFVITVLLLPLLYSCKLLDSKIFSKSKVTADKQTTTTSELPPSLDTQQTTIIPYDKTISVAKYDGPFDIVDERANLLLSNWLLRPSELPNFKGEKPVKTVTLQSILLTKREFETIEEFQKRVQLQEQERAIEIRILEDKYQDSANKYNNSVRLYNEALSEEKRIRNNKAETKYWEFVNTILQDILGNPNIKLVEYNADKQLFYSILGSTKSNLSQWIGIEIPVEKAKLVRKNQNNILPILEFTKNSNSELIIKKISINIGATSYESKMINKPVINSYEHIVRSKPINIVDNYLKINEGNEK